MAVGTHLAIGTVIIGPMLLADKYGDSTTGAAARYLRTTEFLWGISFGMLFIGTAAGVLIMLSELGNAFKADARERTLEPLLTTPLTSRDLMLGHARSAVSHAIPWLILAAVGAVGSLVTNDWAREPERPLIMLAIVVAFLLHLPTLGLVALVSGARWLRNGGLGTTGIVFIGILVTCGMLGTWTSSGFVFFATYLLVYGFLTVWLWRFPVASLREDLLAHKATSAKE
jgi:hypothetical protein